MNPRIETIINRVEGPTVLDLGAVQHGAAASQSENWLHDHLVRRFDRVVGVDILATDVERLNGRGYKMVQADVERMQLPITADTVVAGELIEHLSNPGQMLDRSHEHLRNGGRLVLSTPNPWAFVHLRRHLHESIQINTEHTAWYGPTVLQQLLTRHGFGVVDVTGVTPARGRFSVTRVLEELAVDPFGYTTWVVTAKKRDYVELPEDER